MGQYRIIIEGTGAHHNGKDYDANELAKEVTKKLLAGNHSLKRSTFEVGYYNPDTKNFVAADNHEDNLESEVKSPDGYVYGGSKSEVRPKED